MSKRSELRVVQSPTDERVWRLEEKRFMVGWCNVDSWFCDEATARARLAATLNPKIIYDSDVTVDVKP